MSTLIRLGILVSVIVTASGVAVAEQRQGVSLEECLRIALTEHPAVAAADADIVAARQRTRQAAAALLPQLDGEYLTTRQAQTIGALIQGPGGQLAGSTTLTFNFSRGGFTISQLLFDFGQTMNSTRSGQALSDAARADRLTAEHEITLNVKRAYYQLIAFRRLRDVAKETEAQTRRHLEEAKSRHEIGVAPRFDVTKQEVEVANARLARLVAENNVDLGRANLRNAMGINEELRFDPQDERLDYIPFVLDESTALDRAYDNRPELRSLTDRRRAEEQRMAALRKEYLPVAVGIGNYSFTGSDRPEDEGWLIGANVRLSIFNGGRTTAKIGESRAKLLRLEAELDDLRQRIALEVRRSYLSLRTAEGSIEVSEKAVKQARESLSIAEGRYSAGAGSIIELSDAQVDLAEARANHVRVLTVYWIAIATMQRAIGNPANGENA